MKFLSNLGLLILSCVAMAPAGRGQAAAPEKLRMFVSPRSSSVCFGEKALVLDVLVVNQSGEDQSVDTAHFRASVAFSEVFSASSAIGRSSGMAVMPDRIGAAAPPHVVVLKPKEAFETQLALSLSHPFFGKPGLYRAMPSITLGSIERPASLTDGLIFELRDCE